MSERLAERNPRSKGQLTPFLPAARNRGGVSEHPVPGCSGAHGPTVPVARITKLVLLSEALPLQGFFWNRHCSPLLQIAPQRSDSYQGQGQPRAHSGATVLPAEQERTSPKGIALNQKNTAESWHSASIRLQTPLKKRSLCLRCAWGAACTALQFITAHNTVNFAVK